MEHRVYGIPYNFKESKVDLFLLRQKNGHKIVLSRTSRFWNIKCGLVGIIIVLSSTFIAHLVSGPL